MKKFKIYCYDSILNIQLTVKPIQKVNGSCNKYSKKSLNKIKLLQLNNNV